MYQRTKATLIARRWESAPWWIDAKTACASHEVLTHASNYHSSVTTWALGAFHCEMKALSAAQANKFQSRLQQSLRRKGV